MIYNVGKEDFKKEVLESEKPVLVDFWAPWCVYCRRIAPVIDRLDKELGDKIKIVKVDIDQAQGLEEDYGIEVIPTLVGFMGGQLVDKVVNPPSQSAIKDWLEDNGLL